ncbi:MAG: diphthine synthase [Nanoarchaeota archaeon]
MVLYLIGLGLGDEHDITLKGLDAIKKCAKVYLESYTSRLSNENIPALEKLYGKKIIRASRSTIEEQEAQILREAQEQDIAILIPGSPFSATTHMELVLSARKKNITLHIIENASILTAVGITGLFLYKFGRVTTIPFENKNITSPYEVYLENNKQGLHTLFLLDIQGDKMMSAKEGCEYLLKQGLPKTTKVIACAALGSNKQEIQIAEAQKIKLSPFPQCLIVPGKLNFKEEEALALYT